jgi:hypothetical protein
MSSTAIRASGSASSGRLTTALWIAALAIGLYFVVGYVPRYLIWSEEMYGPYFWPRATILLPHLLGGLVAIVMGPLQFWPHIRNNYPMIHRVSGRIYLAAVLVGALGGMAMAVTSGVNVSYASGLFALAIAWLLTSGMALASILRRNFVQHKQWMVRSYVVTFAFVTFRVVDDTLLYFGIGERAEYVAMLTWACWAIPLLFAELVMQGRQVFARR